MTPAELKNYLKENLKIAIGIGENSYRDTLEVRLYLENELFSYSEIDIDELPINK